MFIRFRSDWIHGKCYYCEYHFSWTATSDWLLYKPVVHLSTKNMWSLLEISKFKRKPITLPLIKWFERSTVLISTVINILIIVYAVVPVCSITYNYFYWFVSFFKFLLNIKYVHMCAIEKLHCLGIENFVTVRINGRNKYNHHTVF